MGSKEKRPISFFDGGIFLDRCPTQQLNTEGIALLEYDQSHHQMFDSVQPVSTRCYF